MTADELTLLSIAEAGERLRRRSLSPVEFRDGHEYEDDFCYAQIISRWVVEPPREEDVAALLQRFASFTEGEPKARLALCQALASRDPADYYKGGALLPLGGDVQPHAILNFKE
jgi:hypothetical protein